MNFSFGIITDGTQEHRLQQVIKSIVDQNINNYEIIIVGGGKNVYYDMIRRISFDESIKKGWITKKKNLIIHNAKYENIVFLHDYIILNKNWYIGFLKFGNDFNIVTNQIEDIHGRYRDWTLYKGWVKDIPIPEQEKQDMIKYGRMLIPYEFDHLNNYQYISGAYWVAKKEVMIKEPLDESRCHGQAEDIQWAKQVKNKYGFKFNPYSKVFSLKERIRAFRPITKKQEDLLRDLK